MESKALVPIFVSFLLILPRFISTTAEAADVDDGSLSLHVNNGTLEWRHVEPEFVEDDAEELEEGEEELGQRRSLLYWGHQWPRRRYYISYGALSANRIPCPPRSGRSYYTHNCYRARGPVHPYTRGCSAITRCRR